MKKYDLTFNVRKPDTFEVISSDRAESDDLLQLMFQLQFMVINALRDEYERKLDEISLRRENNDIPF